MKRLVTGSRRSFRHPHAAPVSKRLAKALPDAELHIVDGGHTHWVHHADQIAPMLTAFLGRTPGSHRDRKTDTTP